MAEPSTQPPAHARKYGQNLVVVRREENEEHLRVLERQLRDQVVRWALDDGHCTLQVRQERSTTPFGDMLLRVWVVAW